MASKKSEHQKQFDGLDNNGQNPNAVRGGEHRNGRLSQFKNHNAIGGETPNEYVDEKRDS